MENQSTGELLHSLSQALGLKNPDTKVQSHGKTIAEMKEHHANQIAGTTKKIEANLDSRYKINEHESHMIHIIKDQMQFDPNGGKKLSQPIQQKYYVEDFVKMSETVAKKKESGGTTFPENAFATYKVTIIHDPRKDEVATTSTPKATKQKDLSKLSMEELREVYKTVIGEDAAEEDTAPQMIALIKDAQK